jgi:hypothetical protein
MEERKYFFLKKNINILFTFCILKNEAPIFFSNKGKGSKRENIQKISGIILL